MALARWRPDETRDVTHEDGFGVVIEGGFVWFWTASGWETQPSEMWAWQFVRGDYGSRVWTPKLLTHVEHLQHQPERRPPRDWKSVVVAIGATRWNEVVAQARTGSNSQMGVNVRRLLAISSVGSVLLKHIRNSGDRKLDRTYQLVCRNWAIQSIDDPIGWNVKEDISRDILYSCEDGLGVVVQGRAVWLYTQREWRTQSNELWAWRLLHCRDQRWMRIWVPKLLSPIEYWQYHQRHAYTQQPTQLSARTDATQWDQSTLPPLSATFISHQPVPSVITVITPWLFGLNCISEDRELCRTCRLVCRDWAKQFPLGNSEPWKLFVEESGAAWYRPETEWMRLHNRFWAWSYRDFLYEWWVEPSDQREQCQWYPKLVRPVDASLRRNPTHALKRLSPSLSGASRRSAFSTAAALPPELFQYICDAADEESGVLRLVCRYWNRLCTPHVFRRIDAEHSPKHIRALWRHRKDLSMQHVNVIEGIPDYDSTPRFPWVHLLTQTCTSTHSEWKSWGDQLGRIGLEGPFAGGLRTIRSVHFDLPRSLPRSLSRGIKKLHLSDIHLTRFEDLIHLVCELPDLEELYTDANFDSAPIELPRRRPRTNRNRLKKVVLTRGGALLHALVLYLSVYDVKSFYSEGEIAVLLALVQLSPLASPSALVGRYEHNSCNNSRRLDFKDRNDTFLDLQILRDPAQNPTTVLVIVDLRGAAMDKEPDRWTRLDSEFNKISSQMRQAEFVLGFADRADMVHFATNILVKMPSIYRLADVLYSIYILQDSIGRYISQWYRASLDSEDLTGMGEYDLAKVYS